MAGLGPYHGIVGVAGSNLLPPGDPGRCTALLRTEKRIIGRMPHIGKL